MSFDITKVIIGIEVSEDEFESTITSFRHYKSGNELNFGMKGKLLCDVESHRADRIQFPKEVGKYTMLAEYNDSSEIIESIWDIQKID